MHIGNLTWIHYADYLKHKKKRCFTALILLYKEPKISYICIRNGFDLVYEIDLRKKNNF